MTNLISQIFKNKNKKLVTFVTGGDPDFKTSNEILKIIIENGVDIVEIGMPFSDPMADGPTIQLSSNRALENNIDLDHIFELGQFAQPYAKSNQEILSEVDSSKQRILFEGAQGFLLDIDHGTYPYVTSSNVHASYASIGSGLSPQLIDHVLAITKAYTTRVGNGPFPTELDDDIGNKLGEIGKEFGTVTNRKRRCGWFDAVLVKQAIAISGINEIVITKLDVLDSLDEIKICIGYDINGKKYDFLPFNETFQKKIKPHYVTIPGWKTSTYGVSNWSDLPDKAKNYIHAIEDFIDAKISSISTSPEREDTILLENPLK